MTRFKPGRRSAWLGMAVAAYYVGWWAFSLLSLPFQR